MTLILCAIPENCPVLFGDLLISGNEREGCIPSIPGVGKASDIFPEGSGYTITGLRQKVCLINDSFAIAWAGSLIAARVVISELSELSGKKEFSPDKIREYFDGLGDDIKELGVSFIALFVDSVVGDQVRCCIITHNANSYGYTPFGSLFVSGSGHHKAIELLKKLRMENSSWEKAPTPEDQAISMAYYLGASFLNDDITSNDTLLNYFGGGYEAVIFLDGRLRKLNNTAYIFWQAHIEEDGGFSLSLPFKVFFHHYHNDFLGIRFFSIRHGDSCESIELELEEHSMDIISPVNKVCGNEEIQALKDSDLDIERLANYIDVFNANNEYLTTHYAFDFLKGREVGVRFSQRGIVGEEITMTIEREFLMYLMNELARKGKELQAE